MTIGDAIAFEVSRLSEPQQQRVLEYTRSIETPAAVPAGVRPADLSRLVGLFPATDLDDIQRAIEDGCEGVDAEAW